MNIWKLTVDVWLRWKEVSRKLDAMLIGWRNKQKERTKLKGSRIDWYPKTGIKPTKSLGRKDWLPTMKPIRSHGRKPLRIGWRVAGGTGCPSSCASLSDRASWSNSPRIPHFHSMSEAKRSECVGLSACVKHGHVVQSKYCKWLPFDYFRPSIQTQTLVAYSLHDELLNCQCHFSSLSFAHALWPLVSCIHFSSC